MMDQNLRLADRRNHRGVFFIGAGVLCAVAVTLAGCSGLSKKKEPSAAVSQTKQVKTERARFAKSERARKAAVQKLAIALANNKTLQKQLLGARNTARTSSDELQAADKDIADLESELAKANTQPAKTGKVDAAPQQSEQLDKAVKESRAESEKQNKQVQAALAKADSALKERAQVEQAATKEAEALRDQLTTAKQQISDAQAEAKTARAELATANDEIARLKAVGAEKPISSATQQPAQPQ